MLKTTAWMAQLRDDLKHRHLKPFMPGLANGDQPSAPVIKVRFDSECAAATARSTCQGCCSTTEARWPPQRGYGWRWSATRTSRPAEECSGTAWTQCGPWPLGWSSRASRGQAALCSDLCRSSTGTTATSAPPPAGGGRGLEGQAMGASAAAQTLRVGDRERLGSAPRHAGASSERSPAPAAAGG